MKYIIFVDCDGTITDDNSNITKRTINSIQNLMNNNCHVVICSGKPRYSANWIKERVSASKYIISSNGAEIYDADKHEIILQNTIQKEVCLDVCTRALACDCRIVLVSDNYEYVTEVAHSEHQKIMDDYKKTIKSRDIKQIFITNNNFDKINNLRDYVLKLDDIKIVNESSSFSSNSKSKYEKGAWFSIANTTTSKGDALNYLVELLEIPKENVYAMGNDYNDVSMFRSAGISICLENSPQDIKQIVDIVTSSNNDEGAAKAFEQILKEITK